MSTRNATNPVFSVNKGKKVRSKDLISPKEEIGVGTHKEKFPKDLRIEPHETLKEVQLVTGSPEKKTRIGT